MKEINLVLPAQAVKMGGDLGAVLGQHGVNIMKFCKEFNNITVNYEYNLPIRILLILEDSSNFSIKIKGPVTSFLIKSFSKNDKQIDILSIYKIAVLKGTVELLTNDKTIIKNILSTIKSMRYTVIYE